MQVIAAIATIEVPENLWPGVMEQLSTPLRSPGTPEPLRVACLETIGYICDALVPNLAEHAHIFDSSQLNLCLSLTSLFFLLPYFYKGF